MRSRPARIAIAFGAVLLVATLGAFFAPPKLGGSTTYSVTDGISMEPMLHKDDLAFVRHAGSYQVGDVVLYNSPVLHKPVLHRILLVQNGNYFFKGDNNGFVDPGYATRSELVGKLWFHLAGVGGSLAWFGSPSHSGAIAGLAVLPIFLAGKKTSRRRRKRRRLSSRERPTTMETALSPSPVTPDAGDESSKVDRRGATSGGPRASDRRSGIDMTPQQLESRRPLSFLEGPTSTLAALVICLVLAVLSVGFGFSRPVDRVVPLAGAYEHRGTFSYLGAAKVPTPVYPSAFVTTGQPIYWHLVDVVTVTFKYRFASALPHHVRGSVELKTRVLSQTDDWQRVSGVARTSFTGNTATVSTSIPLDEYHALLTRIAGESGAGGLSFSGRLEATVHLRGTVGGKAIDERFQPVLPLGINGNAITLSTSSTPAPPGATYALPSATSQLDSTVNPVQAGSIPHPASNVVTVAKYELSVPGLRTLGLVLLGLALLLAITHDVLRRRRTRRSLEEIVAARLHTLIVPVVALSEAELSTATELPGFVQLANLAHLLERPILYRRRGAERTYLVDDDLRCYLFRTDDTATSAAPAADLRAGRSARRAAPRRRKRGALAAAGVTTLVVLAGVTMTLAASFTETSIVPTSSVGSSTLPLAVPTLAPLGCGALSLTSIVKASGFFTNTVSNALILGSAGSDIITDKGARNCIIGGGGLDVIKAKDGSVRIPGPGSGAATVAAPPA